MNKIFNFTIFNILFLLFSNVALAENIKFWTTEEQPARLAKQNAMAADFWKETGHEVEVIPVSEKDLGKRATAAFAAGDLPDVIYHTLQYVLPWSAPGAKVLFCKEFTISSLVSTSKIPASDHGNTYCNV